MIIYYYFRIVLALWSTFIRGKVVINKPSISTIIPTYNRENLIASCIESLLNQTYKRNEIIVVDDGSTDNTLKVLERYQDNIKIILKENGGSSTARNAGLKYASGDYVAYIDSDDQWHPEKLSIFVANIELCKHPDNLLMFSDFSRYDMDKKEYLPLSQTEIYPLIFDYFEKVDDYLYICEGIDLLECLLRPYPFYPSACLLSRSIHDKYLWNDDLLFCQDFEIALKICNQTPFYYIDKPLSTIGIHSSNKSWDVDKKLQGDIDAIKSYSLTIDGNREKISMCNGEIGKRYWIFGHYLRNKNNYIAALSYYMTSLLYFDNIKRLFKSSLTRFCDFFG